MALVDWSPAITAETLRAGHLGRCPSARGSRVVVGETEFDETSARGHVAVIAVTEATVRDNFSRNCR